MATNYSGIDYGFGRTNIDTKTGIRYGVIHHHEVLQAWANSSEADYGPPHCPKCGNQADEPSAFGESFEGECDDDYTHEKYECDDYVCVDCKHFFGSESAFGDEPLGFYVDDGEYQAHQSGDDCDIMVFKSPYFTRAQFCSPCAPGAGHLGNPCPTGPKTYCFGHDWFDEGQAPYPIYDVATGELIPPPAK